MATKTKTVTDEELKTVHDAIRILGGNYAGGHDYIVSMDWFLTHKAAKAGHVVGTILTVEPERTLVEMPTGDEKWFVISKQELRALAGQGSIGATTTSHVLGTGLAPAAWERFRERAARL